MADNYYPGIGLINLFTQPEAPSPAPAPSVIHAEPISPEFISECNYISNTINLKITNTMTNINYIHKINWQEYKYRHLGL